MIGDVIGIMPKHIKKLGGKYDRDKRFELCLSEQKGDL